MSLFTIDVSHILQGPVGTMESYTFEQDTPPDTWEDITCTTPLSMSIRLAHAEYGIECLFEYIKSIIDIPSEGIEGQEISLEHIVREFHLKKTISDTDDIMYIDTYDITIDLRDAIEQEILIAGL